jgi:hypothetical protein
MRKQVLEIPLMSHTPGPWHISRREPHHRPVLRGADRNIITYLEAGTDDCRLIGLAPELLDALKRLVELMPAPTPNTEYDFAFRDAASLIRCAATDKKQ